GQHDALVGFECQVRYENANHAVLAKSLTDVSPKRFQEPQGLRYGYENDALKLPTLQSQH
ncbi:hypothetical protein, partial [Enterobacter hormaechei]